MPHRSIFPRSPSTILVLAGLAIVLTAAPAAFGQIGVPPRAVSENPPVEDHSYTALVGRFNHGPSRANFTALQHLIVGDVRYDSQSRNLAEALELVRNQQYREALAKLEANLPDLLLSPNAHLCAAQCRKALGQPKLQETEICFAFGCVVGLLATGNMSPSQPVMVTHVSDEYDLLGYMKQKPKVISQSLVSKHGRWYDVLKSADGKDYWFDVTLTFGHGPSASPESNGLTVTLAQAEAAYHRGAALIDRRQFADALPDLSEAIRLNPTPDAYYEHGFALLESGNADMAYADFCEAIRLRPSYALAYFERGISQEREGNEKLDPAIADFSEAIRLKPDYRWAYEHRSAAYAKRGDGQHAQADAAKAASLGGRVAAAQ